MISMNPLQKELTELNRLYMHVMSLYSSLNTLDADQLSVSEIIGVISGGIEDDTRTLSLLKESHNRIARGRETAKKEYSDVKASLTSVGELVGKLEKMDVMKAELSSLRRRNGSLRLKVTPLTAKMWGIQEKLFSLRKERGETERKHGEVMKLRDEVISMRSKVLPANELLDLQERLTAESTVVNKNKEEIKQVKEKLPDTLSERDSLKSELQVTLERLSSVQTHIDSMKRKVQTLSPKLISDEEMQSLAEHAQDLREKKASVMKEKKAISPQIASIAEEEEKLATILESYKAKNKKDSAKLATFKKELKELDIDKNSIDMLREKVASLESGLEVKRRSLDSLKKEHDEVVNQNQKYKAIIEEVAEGTKKLKKMMKKK